ncbi:MAG: 2'-5' RNA ligase family protein [Dermatophilaceae bacterium]|nr:2'-5' RNA ligase family protein [Dermatophilaceae bacterium]NUR81593.1 2'-5' RNA ligase family protein [Dermatophilaceae bacterium]
MTPGHSVLQVPVPQLEPFVRARHAHYDQAYVSDDPSFGHAHVTALGPFLPRDSLTPGALTAVAEIASSTAPFAFTLERIDTFPNGIVHLLPNPATTFVALTRRLWDAFPQCPPYAGEFADVVPHLTLDAVSSEVTEASTAREVAPWLPAACRAEQLQLAWYEPGACRVLHAWPLSSASC